jgi:hypothetical protein
MVRIAGYEVLSICTADGSVAAGVRMICGLLGIHYLRQLRKLQTDPDFRDCLILAKVEIAGQQRVVWFIIAESIPLWLKGIHPSKVAPEARETLEEFRSVAVQTLRAFFFPETREPPKQSAPPKPEPPQPPLPPPDAPPVSMFDMLRTVINSMEQEHHEIQAWKARLTTVEQEQRVLADQHTKAQRQLQALQTEVLALQTARKDSPPAADAALSGEHEEVLYVLLYCAELITGQPEEDLGRELLAKAGVQEMGQIREADWFDMVVWLVKRLG